MSKRLPFLLAGAAVLVMLATIALRWHRAAPAGAPALQVVSLFPQPRVLPDFNLRQSDGTALVPGELKGHWTLVFLGFTHCPDVCPTTLQALAAAQDQLGPKSRDLQVVFVSVDPARDTPAQLKAYLSAGAFPKGVIGLTGTPEQVAAMAKAYHAFYEKAGEGETYLVNHSTPTYLMDPRGGFNRVIPYNLPPDEIARQISDAMRAG